PALQHSPPARGSAPRAGSRPAETAPSVEGRRRMRPACAAEQGFAMSLDAEEVPGRAGNRAHRENAASRAASRTANALTPSYAKRDGVRAFAVRTSIGWGQGVRRS